MIWQDLIVAVALLLVLEGILPFLNPEGMRKAILTISQLTDQQLRFGGLTSMILGIILLYIIK